MITFKIDNIEISYLDPELNELLVFALLKDGSVDVGTFDSSNTVKKNHEIVDLNWKNAGIEALQLMHEYVDNMIPCDKFINFISNNKLFEQFDFKTGLFTCEVIIK